MKHIETYILNSWKKVPDDFKKRVKYNITAGVASAKLPYGISFSSEAIDERLQIEVNKVVVNALGAFYNFTEDEALEMLRKMSK